MKLCGRAAPALKTRNFEEDNSGLNGGDGSGVIVIGGDDFNSPERSPDSKPSNYIDVGEIFDVSSI